MIGAAPGSLLDPGPSSDMPARLCAPQDWQRIDLLSDLHLDTTTPATTAAFLAYLQRTPADAVLVLGDLFEVWVGADALDDPASHEAHLGAALRKAAGERLVGFLSGNRDFLLDAPTCARLGMTALPDPTVLIAWGERILLTHGDAWCMDDVDYQRFRVQVRSATWQRDFLAQPLSVRRTQAAGIRARSEALKRQRGADTYADVDRATAMTALQQTDCRRLIHGHTHRPGDEAWMDDTGQRLQRHVLSDWDLDHEPWRAEILCLTPTGTTRLPVTADGHTTSQPAR